MKKKILYIEDEPFLGKIVKETLESQDFEVLLKNDGALVMNVFKSFIPDICILDVMLPNVDGFTLGLHIRSQYPKLPIIFVTAKIETDDLIKGFESGGTDYIKKPFSMKELIARINNQMNILQANRQVNNVKNIKIELGQFVFLQDKYELIINNKIKKLSLRESQVLTILAAHRNQTVARKTLLMSVWGDDSFFNSRTLDVYIRKLRAYLSEDPRIEIITLKGMGYHFIVP
jgi:two-component system, OmpR family, response regulator VicR